MANFNQVNADTFHLTKTPQTCSGFELVRRFRGIADFNSKRKFAKTRKLMGLTLFYLKGSTLIKCSYVHVRWVTDSKSRQNIINYVWKKVADSWLSHHWCLRFLLMAISEEQSAINKIVKMLRSSILYSPPFIHICLKITHTGKKGSCLI